MAPGQEPAARGATVHQRRYACLPVPLQARSHWAVSLLLPQQLGQPSTIDTGVHDAWSTRMGCATQWPTGNNGANAHQHQRWEIRCALGTAHSVHQPLHTDSVCTGVDIDELAAVAPTRNVLLPNRCRDSLSAHEMLQSEKSISPRRLATS